MRDEDTIRTNRRKEIHNSHVAKHTGKRKSLTSPQFLYSRKKSESKISDDPHHPHAHQAVLQGPQLQAVNHR